MSNWAELELQCEWCRDDVGSTVTRYLLTGLKSSTEHSGTSYFGTLQSWDRLAETNTATKLQISPNSAYLYSLRNRLLCANSFGLTDEEKRLRCDASQLPSRSIQILVYTSIESKIGLFQVFARSGPSVWLCCCRLTITSFFARILIAINCLSP